MSQIATGKYSSCDNLSHQEVCAVLAKGHGHGSSGKDIDRLTKSAHSHFTKNRDGQNAFIRLLNEDYVADKTKLPVQQVLGSMIEADFHEPDSGVHKVYAPIIWIAYGTTVTVNLVTKLTKRALGIKPQVVENDEEFEII